VLALIVGTVATIGALALNVNDYENFLLLIGSVFVPLLGVFVVDWYLLSRGEWDLTERARTRWSMLAAWALGFVAYQLVNPGYVSWWAGPWTRAEHLLHFTPDAHTTTVAAHSWVSASLVSFVVAALAALVLGARRRDRAISS
jgi:cytosine/uracil/thiamine/allantoin permease